MIFSTIVHSFVQSNEEEGKDFSEKLKKNSINGGGGLSLSSSKENPEYSAK